MVQSARARHAPLSLLVRHAADSDLQQNLRHRSSHPRCRCPCRGSTGSPSPFSRRCDRSPPRRASAVGPPHRAGRTEELRQVLAPRRHGLLETAAPGRSLVTPHRPPRVLPAVAHHGELRIGARARRTACGCRRCRRPCAVGSWASTDTRDRRCRPPGRAAGARRPSRPTLGTDRPTEQRPAGRGPPPRSCAATSAISGLSVRHDDAFEHDRFAERPRSCRR